MSSRKTSMAGSSSSRSTSDMVFIGRSATLVAMKVATAVYTPAVALRANRADLTKVADCRLGNLSLTQRPAHAGRGCFKALQGIADQVAPGILRLVECRVRAREDLIEQVRSLARGKACADSDAKI